ncbi:MAG TPA: hypothetical protein VJ913_04765 [Actinomycetota bacterium]|nr:hypothetical protein [Actinomycetota bacterium]
MMNADGSEIEQLTDLPGDETAPAWSPDGETIAFAFDDGGSTDFRGGVATLASDGSGVVTELFARTNEVADGPEWSPDGDRIGFTLFTAEGMHPYVMAADGADAARLRDERALVLGWTPDGQRILLSEDASFVTVRPDGSGERVFIEDVPEKGRLVIDWSPDGQWIIASTPQRYAQISGGPANLHMYLMRADGSQTFWIGSGAEPSWSPEDG